MKSWWKICNLLCRTNRKAWRILCYGIGGFCQLQSRGFALGEGQVESDRLSLQHHAIQSGTRLVGQGFVLMQDSYPKHTSELCQRYIKSKEKQPVLQLMSWPALSANLNLIELDWDELDRNVRTKQPPSAAHLWQFLQKSWAVKEIFLF